MWHISINRLLICSYPKKIAFYRVNIGFLYNFFANVISQQPALLPKNCHPSHLFCSSLSPCHCKVTLNWWMMLYVLLKAIPIKLFRSTRDLLTTKDSLSPPNIYVHIQVLQSLCCQLGAQASAQTTWGIILALALHVISSKPHPWIVPIISSILRFVE